MPWAPSLCCLTLPMDMRPSASPDRQQGFELFGAIERVAQWVSCLELRLCMYPWHSCAQFTNLSFFLSEGELKVLNPSHCTDVRMKWDGSHLIQHPARGTHWTNTHIIYHRDLTWQQLIEYLGFQRPAIVWYHSSSFHVSLQPKLVYGKCRGLPERFWDKTDVGLNPILPLTELGDMWHIFILRLCFLLNHNSTYFTSAEKLPWVSCHQAAFPFGGGRFVPKGILATCWCYKSL